MKAKIGTYTWVKINSKGNLILPDGIGTWQRLPIIGENKTGIVALLAQSPCRGYVIDDICLKQYHIDSGYQGCKMITYLIDCLKYDGAYCFRCNQFFGYLKFQEFKCWECEV